MRHVCERMSCILYRNNGLYCADKQETVSAHRYREVREVRFLYLDM